MKKTYTLITLITLFAMAQLPGFAQDWNFQTIGNYVDDEQLIRVDNNGMPHCLIDDKYYRWDGVSWQNIIVPYSNPSWPHTFCVNDNGVAHIANRYLHNSVYSIFHQYLENNVWKRDTVISGGSHSSTPLAIFYGPNSPSNKPDILWYHDFLNDDYMNIVKYNNSSQQYVNTYLFSIRHSPDDHAYPNADYCTDQNGNLYYVYTGEQDEIVFNFYDGTNWSSFYITDGTNDCQHPRITLDQNDIPHVSYYDMVTQDLIHAKLPAQTLKLLKEGKLTSKVPSQIVSETAQPIIE